MRITARDLRVASGKTIILKDLSLHLEPGLFVGILGPSGSGKSTLLNALSGRHPITSGIILHDDQPVSGRTGRSVGFVPQDDTLHLSLKTDKVLTYAARLQMPELAHAEIAKIVTTTLASVGLQDRAKLPVQRLSGGQRKRVSIALELLLSPKGLFLDEPTSGLDPELEKTIMGICARLASEGRLVLMTTHILDSIQMFDRVLFLEAGEIAFLGTPTEALDFFGVSDIHHVYPLLTRADAARFPALYRRSPFCSTPAAAPPPA
jgi:ABC-type multidrug transport system ATPase subunit